MNIVRYQQIRHCHIKRGRVESYRTSSRPYHDKERTKKPVNQENGFADGAIMV
jgi:hypothetical protein